MPRNGMIGLLAAGLLAGCSAAGGADGLPGDQCSCPPGPAGPQGPKGDKGAPGESEGWRSGSRLQVRALRAEDGAQFPLHFWDGDLGVLCGPSEVGEVFKCLPITPHASGVYVDPHCTEFGVATMGSADAIYRTRGAYYRLGRTRPRAYVQATGHGCIEIDRDERTIYELAEKIEMEAFATFLSASP